MPPQKAPTPNSWEAAVVVREEYSLEEELVARLGRASGTRAVGVTDLLALRRSFYRVVGPTVPIAADRQARLDRGRAFHRTLGVRLAREGALEARVRRDGLVGRIDILSDVPIEVKTVTMLVDPSELTTSRPDHVEQLAMYCALLERPAGRLLSFVPGPNGISEVQAVDMEFPSPGKTLSEMRRRAELLRTAWAEARVDRLPRCPWFGRGCEFEEASVCACTGREEPMDRPIGEVVGTVSRREDVEERIRSSLSGPTPSEAEPPVERYREILYPRRAYYDRTTPAAPLPPPAEGGPAPAPPPDLYARLSEALESGPAGEVARLPARSAEPEEETVGFRDRPLLLKTSRAWSRYRPDEVIARAPQYALDLGLRCAITGTEAGLVVVGFERAATDRDRVQVLELRFPSRTPFARMYRERSRGLAAAIRNRSPAGLPACPAWMAPDCPYRAECGCAGPSERATR